ncbi:hypothetical protein THERMOT_1194 [Bathymodiolus thermophilus thioautotrophic gill symbiont]|nr:hypothetical protein THERMOT_1194 [Bathymodiolus thermophilus thioautotrophic gill symbiont]
MPNAGAPLGKNNTIPSIAIFIQRSQMRYATKDSAHYNPHI